MDNTASSTEEKRRQHIQEMREKLERFFGQPSIFISQENGNSEFEEKFLEHILAMEGVDEAPLFDALVEGGVDMPPAGELDDTRLSPKLWEVIRAMALLGHYLYHTDHLSDRQLYELLWTEILREPTSVLPSDPTFACHIDILGGCSDEDMQLNLKYYADEDYRQEWSESECNFPIPAHEDPPYDRDRHLPQPDFNLGEPRECS